MQRGCCSIRELPASTSQLHVLNHRWRFLSRAWWTSFEASETGRARLNIQTLTWVNGCTRTGLEWRLRARFLLLARASAVRLEEITAILAPRVYPRCPSFSLGGGKGADFHIRGRKLATHQQLSLNISSDLALLPWVHPWIFYSDQMRNYRRVWYLHII